MSEREWPYNLPIWRSSHRAASPDGTLVARIDPAHEVSMGNPTSGILCVSNGLHVERCNPSFVWSDDSNFLAVPQFFQELVLFRRQRVLVISFQRKMVYASNQAAWYFQPESFDGGRLVVTPEPTHGKRRMEFLIPDDLPKVFFRHVGVAWPEM